MEAEDYVTLNQLDNENPSTVAFVQDNYEYLKNKIKSGGIITCIVIFLFLHFIQILIGFVIIPKCPQDHYTPAYFIVAGLIGCTSKSINCVTIKNERYRIAYKFVYVIYAFEVCWLIVGTYYYLLTHKTRHGCSIHAYNLAFWITISTYICLQFSIIVFCWVLSTIFSLVYFKNKIVQYLAKSIRF